MLGVIEMEYHESTPMRPAFIRSHIRADKIPSIVSDPLSIPKLVYGWGTNNFNFPLFANHLLEFSVGLGLSASIQQLRRSISKAYQGQIEQTSKAIETMVKIPFFEAEIAETPIEVGIIVMELPEQDGKPPGIIIEPMIPQGIDNEYEISNELNFLVQAGIDLASTFGILLRPNEITVRYPFQPDNLPLNGSISLALDYKPAATKTMLGSPGSTRLQISGATLGFGGQFGERLELLAELKLKDLTLVISAGDQDSFLSKLLNGKDLIIPFPLVILWSNRMGFHFKGSSGLSVSSDPHLNIGGAKIDKLTLQLLTGDRVDPYPNFAIEILTAISGSIGPISFSMDGLGLQFKLVFKDGNTGPFQIGVGVVLPNGLGLAIDSNGVRGGGFISRTENQYSGVIDLDLRGFSIQSFVILKTDPTLSLLFAIFSQFKSPIQLGGGWKITKIGGLIGLNRTVSLNEIASGIRSGILDSILFPDNVIQNAPRIISDLNRVFPAQPGQQLIGPAIRIVYGTPALIKVDIALILEFPNPFQLSVIGRIKSKIPNEDHPLVQINLAVLGAIDFTNEKLGIYGSLYESKILSFTLSGDMAMAASWGTGEKNFIISIGGFNSRFKPPSNFPPFNAPPLKRLMLAFSSNVSLTCYLALTSNTFQIGARVDAVFKKGATLSGFLNFEALIQFDPLYYIIDVQGGFSVKYSGRSLASIKFSGFIEGPNPHRIKGSVTFSILWWDVSVDVDKTFGSQEPELITNVDPWPILKNSLEQNDSWTADLPPWAIDSVIVKELSNLETTTNNTNDNNKTILVHPVGTLKVSQKIVPLNHTLTKFGAAEPIDNFRFKIDSLGNDSTNLVTIQDYFAPGQFSNYDNTQKLSLKSFDLMDSGVMFGTHYNEISTPIEFVSYKQMTYETIMIPEQPEQQVAPHFPSIIHTLIFELSSTAYQARLAQNQNNIKYNFKQQKPAVSISYEQYLILDTEKNLAAPTEPAVHGSYSQAQAINKLQDFKNKNKNKNNKNNLKVFSFFEKPLEALT